jgi:hypothetical protein
MGRFYRTLRDGDVYTMFQSEHNCRFTGTLWKSRKTRKTTCSGGAKGPVDSLGV